MAGGLLNIVSYGNQNVYLNGNPSKTFFKTVYKKYTNFGLQKFRTDFNGLRNLRMNEPSKFTFKMKRYAELLMDTYLVVTLPTIWSPIYPPQDCSGEWVPYEFKWIDNLGTQMIDEVNITVGGQLLNRYTGSYFLALIQRDFTGSKKNLYDRMTGNVPALNNPGNVPPRINTYPSAYYTSAPAGPEPSIRARKLYIPLNFWFTLAAKMAFPLVALQYNELEIEITLRPVQELIQIRDVEDRVNNYPYIAPNFNNPLQQFYRFLQPPPDISLNTTNSYLDKRTNWNADIHLISTYGFLSEEESKIFALKEQNYLIKSVYQWDFFNITGSQRVKLENTMGMVASWMMYFQRTDVNLRNEWSNYSNWPYSYRPRDIEPAPVEGEWRLTCPEKPDLPESFGPGLDPDTGHFSGIFTTGIFSPENQKNILLALAILLDGQYRENLLDAGVYDYIEKYIRTSGNGPDGLYCYNFCLDTNPFNFQPNGAMNLSRFRDIFLEFQTYTPPLDPLAQTYSICDPETGEVIGVNKPTWRLYDYNYNLIVHEERYNMITFVGGNCALMYAR